MIIRELTDEQFAERYRCDRFTATVLANRFGYIVEHICARMLTAAFSPILRDFYDFAATLTGPPQTGYQTPAMSNSIVLFTGTMTDSVRTTIEEYGLARLEPGDVIIGNDPYRGGTHVNDVMFTRPVFHAGELAGFVNLKAHQLDMGGTIPGGFSAAKHNIYEDGVVISPRALYRAGEPVRETFSLIFDNARFGEILLPDIQTICAELDLGEALLSETIERYGVAAVHGAIDYVCDASAEQIATALAALEDGTWEGEDGIDCDAVDDSEEYRVHVTVSKRGSRMEVDFSGSSRQARTSVNSTPLDAKTTVGVALQYLFNPHGTFTSGTMRCVDLVIPEGTIISALPPDGPVFLYYEQSQVMLGAMLRALAQAVGPGAMAGDRGCTDIHNASGVHPDGTPWVSAAQCGGEVGPFGANRHGDGESQMYSYQSNGMAIEVESIEAGVPVVMLRHEVEPDTAGAGYHRGGSARVRDSMWLEPAEHNLMSLHYKRAPGFGVLGASDGRTGGVWVFDPAEGGFAGLTPTTDDAYRQATPLAGVLDEQTGRPAPDGVYVYPFRRERWPTPAGAVLRVINNGGGGWGDPLEREPERVMRDVRDGYVTIDGAARDYGVVVTGDPEHDPEGLQIDLAASARLRAQRQSDDQKGAR